MDQPTWERRRYWHDGALRQLEWWQGNQPVPRGPQQRPVVVLRREFCYRHGTQIYPDLGCQVCRQRPGALQRDHALPDPSWLG